MAEKRGCLLAQEQASLIRFNPHDGDPELLAQLVLCFRRIFSDPPWGEWLRCANPECGASWGRHQAAELAKIDFEHCGRGVITFWPHAQVLAELRRDITPDASCWIAVMTRPHSVRVVGFTWGMPLPRRWEQLPPGAQDALRRHFGENVAHDVRCVYQAELGVLTSVRRQGLARRLVSARNRDFLSRGCTHGLVRALRDPQPSVTYLWYTSIGYETVYEYPDSGYVLLTRSLSSGMFSRQEEMPSQP